MLFVDEVHRFNKAQQDAFLPHVEAGTVVFIGATTENPSFEVIGALLSRVRVYVLKVSMKRVSIECWIAHCTTASVVSMSMACRLPKTPAHCCWRVPTAMPGGC